MTHTLVCTLGVSVNIVVYISARMLKATALSVSKVSLTCSTNPCLWGSFSQAGKLLELFPFPSQAVRKTLAIYGPISILLEMHVYYFILTLCLNANGHSQLESQLPQPYSPSLTTVSQPLTLVVRSALYSLKYF